MADLGIDVRFAQESITLASNEGKLTGDFLAVIADREFRAVKAFETLAASAQWDERETMPGAAEFYGDGRQAERPPRGRLRPPGDREGSGYRSKWFAVP